MESASASDAEHAAGSRPDKVPGPSGSSSRSQSPGPTAAAQQDGRPPHDAESPEQQSAEDTAAAAAAAAAEAQFAAKIAQSDLRVDIDAAKRAVHNALAGIDVLTRSTHERQQQAAPAGPSNPSAGPAVQSSHTRSRALSRTTSAHDVPPSSSGGWAQRELRSHSSMQQQRSRTNRYPAADAHDLLRRAASASGTAPGLPDVYSLSSLQQHFSSVAGGPMQQVPSYMGSHSSELLHLPQATSMAALHAQLSQHAYSSLPSEQLGTLTSEQLMAMQMSMGPQWQRKPPHQHHAQRMPQLQQPGWVQPMLQHQHHHQAAAALMLLQQQHHQQHHPPAPSFSDAVHPPALHSQQQQQQLLRSMLQQLQTAPGQPRASADALPLDATGGGLSSAALLQVQQQQQQQQQQPPHLTGLFGLLSLYEELSMTAVAAARQGPGAARHSEQQLQGENSLLMALLNILLRFTQGGLAECDCAKDLGFVTGSARRHMLDHSNITPGFRLAMQALSPMLYALCPSQRPDLHQSALACLEAMASAAPDLSSQVALRWGSGLDSGAAPAPDALSHDVAVQLLVRLARSAVKVQKALGGGGGGGGVRGPGEDLVGDLGLIGGPQAFVSQVLGAGAGTFSSDERLSPFSSASYRMAVASATSSADGSADDGGPGLQAGVEAARQRQESERQQALRRCVSAPEDNEVLRSQRLTGLWPHQKAISMPTTWESAEEGEDGSNLRLGDIPLPSVTAGGQELHSHSPGNHAGLAPTGSMELVGTAPPVLLPHELLQPSASLPTSGLYALLPRSLSQQGRQGQQDAGGVHGGMGDAAAAAVGGAGAGGAAAAGAQFLPEALGRLQLGEAAHIGPLPGLGQGAHAMGHPGLGQGAHAHGQGAHAHPGLGQGAHGAHLGGRVSLSRMDRMDSGMFQSLLGFSAGSPRGHAYNVAPLGLSPFVSLSSSGQDLGAHGPSPASGGWGAPHPMHAHPSHVPHPPLLSSLMPQGSLAMSLLSHGVGAPVGGVDSHVPSHSRLGQRLDPPSGPHHTS